MMWGEGLDGVRGDVVRGGDACDTCMGLGRVMYCDVEWCGDLVWSGLVRCARYQWFPCGMMLRERYVGLGRG